MCRETDLFPNLELHVGAHAFQEEVFVCVDSERAKENLVFLGEV